MRKPQPKGPSKMKSGYRGMPGWNYHPTKGFRRDSQHQRRRDYNIGVKERMDWMNALTL